ncbi:methyltransferase-like protein 27 [Glandiceps talaboti]
MDQCKITDSDEWIEFYRRPEKTIEEVKNFYDKWSSQYDELNRTRYDYNSPKYAAIGLSKVLPNREARILDCGAGTGLVGEELSCLGYSNIDAVDMSQPSLDQAQLKGVYKKLICSKLSDEPIEGINQDEYDGIVCSGAFILGHLDDSCLIEMVRVIKPGGVICCAILVTNIHILEGPTFTALLGANTLEKMLMYKVENFFANKDGYVIAYRVTKKQ